MHININFKKISYFKMKLIIFLHLLTFSNYVSALSVTPSDPHNYEIISCKTEMDCDRGIRDPSYQCIKMSKYQNVCAPYRCYRDSDCLNIGRYCESGIYVSAGCVRTKNNFRRHGGICRYKTIAKQCKNPGFPGFF